MLLRRIKLLVTRYFRARRYNIFFFRAKYFVIPKYVKLNNKIINLKLPNEHGVKISFVDIFLDDVYNLDIIKEFFYKNHLIVKNIIDIGANCGLFSILARSYFPLSVIHCYEPNYFLNKYLKNNSKVANFDYFNQAVGNYSGFININIDRISSVHSSISKTKNSKSTKVVQISFKKVCKKIKNKNIDIVKMDCEGSEWEILKNTKIWSNVKILTMEYHLNKKNNYFKLKKIIKNMGFSFLTKATNDNKINHGIIVAYNSKFFSNLKLKNK